MRSIILIAFVALAVARAEIITRWDFNSPVPDEDTATGLLDASIGQGVVHLIGGTTNAFGTVASGATSDPAESDNSQLRVTRFPAQGQGDKSAGIEFRTSTAGYKNIRLVWDHYNSGTASRYWRVQYTINGVVWVDHLVFTNNSASSWLRARTIGFDGIAEVENNPEFGVRIVSEFEESATGAGEAGYRAIGSTSSYSTSGTWWLDMASIEGDPLASATSPIARWNFNSAIPDGDAATGEAPGVTAVGGVSMRFGTVASGATSDKTAEDNSMLRLGSFPSRQEGNKSAGVQFQASTAGYDRITLLWDQYNSATASRYLRLQYSTNSVDFADYGVITNAVASKWHLANKIIFEGVPGIADNPRFAFRLVGEFESSATGAGEDAYRAVADASSYSGAGTLWLDMVTLLGTAVLPVTNKPGETVTNTAPLIILPVSEVTMDGTEPQSIGFSFFDAEQPPDEIHMSLVSSDENVVAVLTPGANTTSAVLVIAAREPLPTTAEIQIRASDGFLVSSQKIIVHIVPTTPTDPPGNTPPVILFPLSELTIDGTKVESIGFSFFDREQSASDVAVTVISGNTNLFAVLAPGATATERVLVIAAREPLRTTGEIEIVANDGMAAASHKLVVQIVPPPRSDPPDPPTNGAPVIALLVSEVTMDGTKPESIAFSFFDAEQSGEEITVTARSSSSNLFAVVTPGASATNRVLVIAARELLRMTAEIGVFVSDGSATSSVQLVVHVIPPEPEEPPEPPDPPVLGIRANAGGVVLFWTADPGVFQVESSADFAGWEPFDASPVQREGTLELSVSTEAAARCFRLKQRSP